MERETWKIPINEETTDEDIERCILDAARTSDINIQGNAARAIVEKDRRERDSELSIAKETINELERTITGLRSAVRDDTAVSPWTRWQTYSGWITAAAMVVIAYAT